MKITKNTVLLALAIVFCIMFIRYWHRAETREAADFKVTHAAAVRFIHKENLYEKFQDTTIANFKYSPMFALLVMPLGYLSLHQAAMVFFAINFISLIFIFILSRKIISPDKEDAKNLSWLYLIPLVFCFRYITNCLDAGQINIIMILLATAGIYCLKKGRDIPAAALLALSIQFKYMTFLFLPYFLFRKRFKLIAWCGAFSALYLCLPALYVGIENEILYLKGWLPFISQTSLDYGSICDLKNQSFPSMILRYFARDTFFGDSIHIANLSKPAALLLSMFLAGCMYLTILLPRRDSINTGSSPNHLDLIDLSLIFICIPLFNPNSWTFNYLALAFPVMTLVYFFLKNGISSHKLVFTLLILSFVVGNVGSKSLVGKDLQSFCHTLSFVVISALILFKTLLYLKFIRPSRI